MGFSMNQMMGIILAVVLVVVGLVLAPIVIDQVSTTAANGNIANYPGTSALLDLVPLLYIVGVLGLAAGVAFLTFRAGKANG